MFAAINFIHRFKIRVLELKKLFTEYLISQSGFPTFNNLRCFDAVGSASDFKDPMWMMRATVDEHEVKVAADGGVEVLRKLFCIPLPEEHSTSPSSLSLDVVLVSFDLETSGRTSKGQRDITKVNEKEVSGIREAGFAVLDTRSFFPPSSSSSQQQPDALFNEAVYRDGNGIKHKLTPPLISTKQFSTLHDSKDFEDCDFTNFRECAFAKTRHVEKEQLVDTITSCLRFPSTTAGMREIVIVGQSPQRDLEISRKLGVELSSVSPISAVLDTHRLSRSILGPHSPLVVAGRRPALERHALPDILTEPGVPFDTRDLHNAGNDATYTLHALILLAVRYAECVMAEGEPTQEQLEHVERLRAVARAEFEAPKWKAGQESFGCT
ncbi:hypothetical protein M406DRAFT_330029 [Cryphonectria parasitica EP155]|uniref:Gfd2/YDR514C-like C-terminal domain-containing protein n=1 Tax=Cryphonectria parasitica (strain ATCC 38755 / EP155) TaxID=660469 RepID=A0A9P5CQF5_CRYP1|nr:uncharacterized protein M406DRAFT_330029 [Cryphonectria parasitica EP155]KAF3766191.1 hypothetical protein M406DRAFT_330029 [Cryphonectria parasitica EP155]